MALPNHVYVATLIGENLEPLQEIVSNSDNIYYGEMIHAHDGSEEGITTFTDRAIESLKELLAGIRFCTQDRQNLKWCSTRRGAEAPNGIVV